MNTTVVKNRWRIRKIETKKAANPTPGPIQDPVQPNPTEPDDDEGIQSGTPGPIQEPTVQLISSNGQVQFTNLSPVSMDSSEETFFKKISLYINFEKDGKSDGVYNTFNKPGGLLKAFIVLGYQTFVRKVNEYNLFYYQCLQCTCVT